MKQVIWAVLLPLFLMLTTKPVIASPVISEVYPRPHIDEKEWIEVFNDSEESVDLSGWILMDELSSPSIIYEFGEDSSDLQLLESQSFLVIELSTSKLNNSADTIKLISSDDEVIDQFDYLDSEFEMSFSLIKNNLGEKQVILSIPTKGEQNYQNEPQPTEEPDNQDGDLDQNYPDLSIIEVMACPETNSLEWVKIENPSEIVANLSNWQILDEASNKIILPDIEISPGFGSTTVTLENNILNNSGDSVSLFNPNHELVDQFTYNNCNIGVPLSKNSLENDNSPTPSPTPNDDQSDKYLEDNDQNGDLEGKSANTSSTTDQIPSLQKINSLLKTANIDKLPPDDNKIFRSKQISISHKSLPKYAVISVIIGGVILSGSGIFFIRSPNEKSQKNN